MTAARSTPLARRQVALGTSVRAIVILFALTGCDRSPDVEALLEERWFYLEAEAQGDTVDVEFPLQAVSTGTGHIDVATHGISRRVMRLDSAAGLVGLIGSFGEGPGEYSLPIFLIEKSDSLIVFDVSGRVSVFGPDGNFERIAFRNPAMTQSAGQGAVLRGDTLLLAQHIPSLGEFGYPLHIVSPDGQIIRSFGVDDRTVDPDFMMNQWRMIANENDSSVWAVGPAAYSLELWSMSGVLLRVLEPQRSWWIPMVWDGSPQRGSERPHSRATALYKDQEADELLVLIHRAREDWRPPGDEAEGGASHLLTDDLAYIEQIVEVLDSRTGDLRTVVVNDTGVYFLRFLSDGRLFGVRGTEDGLYLPSIWRIGSSTTGQRSPP